jgi:hypothetical protein
MKLVYNLAILDKAIAFQVLEQSVRGSSDLGDYVSTTLFCVESSGHPELSSKTCFLRGTDIHRDLEVAIRAFYSNEERDRYVSNLTQALAEVERVR